MRLTKRGTTWNHDQAGSQWSPRQVFVLIAVMVLAFALYPVGARAAQAVNAIITDPGGANEATVDAGGSLHTTSADDPGRMAFQQERIVSIRSGAGASDRVHVNIPAGKRLVITHVSGHLVLPVGQKVIRVSLVTTLGEPLLDGHSFVPIFAGNSLSDVRDHFLFSQDTLIYADPPGFEFSWRRSDNSGPQADMLVAVSGYLIDCSVATCN